LDVLIEKKALIKIVGCKNGVMSSKWILVRKKMFLFLCGREAQKVVGHV